MQDRVKDKSIKKAKKSKGKGWFGDSKRHAVVGAIGGRAGRNAPKKKPGKDRSDD